MLRFLIQRINVCTFAEDFMLLKNSLIIAQLLVWVERDMKKAFIPVQTARNHSENQRKFRLYFKAITHLWTQNLKESKLHRKELFLGEQVIQNMSYLRPATEVRAGQVKACLRRRRGRPDLG